MDGKWLDFCWAEINQAITYYWDTHAHALSAAHTHTLITPFIECIPPFPFGLVGWSPTLCLIGGRTRPREKKETVCVNNNNINNNSRLSFLSLAYTMIDQIDVNNIMAKEERGNKVIQAQSVPSAPPFHISLSLSVCLTQSVPRPFPNMRVCLACLGPSPLSPPCFPPLIKNVPGTW